MARPKATSGKKQVRKLTKVAGSSYSLALPVEVIRKFKWKERQSGVKKPFYCLEIFKELDKSYQKINLK